MPLFITNWLDFWFITVGLGISLMFAEGVPFRLIVKLLRHGRPLNPFLVRFVRIDAIVAAFCCTFALLQYLVFHLRR
jgi:hypothetical protein